MKHVNWIKRNGFVRVGHFAGVGAGHFIKFDNPIEDQPSVYAFCLSDRVMYVGSAEHPRTRLGAYRRRQTLGPTVRSRAVQHGLAESLAIAPVDIYIHTLPERFDLVDGRPVDMLLGLEHGLIDLFDCPWNKRGRRREAVEELSTGSKSELAKLRKKLAISD